MANWANQKQRTKNEKLAAQTIGHMKSQQCTQKVSISVTEEEAFYHVLLSHKNWLPLEDEKLKTGLFSDDIERDTDEICGLEKVLGLIGLQSRTEDLNPQRQSLLTQPFNWTQQLHMSKSSQSNWICSNTGDSGVCLLELVPHPPAMTKMQSYAINPKLASTGYEVWRFHINSILLKRTADNQCQRGSSSRRHKMLPHTQKPSMLFTRQSRT